MFDQTQDKDRSVLYQISTLVGEIPAFVKEASPATEEDVRHMPNEAFADELNRMYPIHTKADTWLSAAYINKNAFEEDTPLAVRNKISEACELWGIQEDSAAMQMPKQAAAEGVRIEYRLGGDTKASTFVSHPDELIKVAEDAMYNPSKYPWQMRRDVGRQVLAAAPRLNATFSGSMEDMLNKTSAYAVGEVSEVYRAIQQRQAVSHYYPGLSEKLAYLEDAVTVAERNGIVDPDMLDKVASVLDAVDRTTGLHLKYGYGLTPPEQQICTTTQSQIDAFNKLAYKLPSGQHAAKDMLMRDQTIHWVEDCLGQKIASLEDFDKLSYRHAELVYDFTQELEKQASCGCGGMGALAGEMEEEEDEDESEENEMGGPIDISEIIEKITGQELPEEMEEVLEDLPEGEGATIVIKEARTLGNEELQEIAEERSKLFDTFLKRKTDPLTDDLSDPTKGAFVGGALGGTVGTTAGHLLDTLYGGDKSIGKILGGVTGAGIGALSQYHHRKERNKEILDMVKDLPRGATRGQAFAKNPRFDPDLNRFLEENS